MAFRRSTLALILLILLARGPDPAQGADAAFPFRRYYGNPAPESPGSRPYFYTNSIEDDLRRLYESEREAATQGLKPSGSRRQRLQARSRRMHDAFAAPNRKVVEILEKSASEAPAPTEKTLSREGAEALRREILAHPVAGPAGERKYDPKYRIGFCFGRAAYAHLRLSKLGHAQSEMAKIFMLGKLRHTNSLWEFHMATLILGKDDSGKRVWWVIDSLFDRVYDAKTWIAKVTRFALQKEFPDVRFYTSDPRKLHTGPGEYDASSLSLPEFNGYFDDLAKTL